MKNAGIVLSTVVLFTALVSCGKGGGDRGGGPEMHDLLQSAPPGSWRTFRGDPGLSGVAATDIPATLGILWSYATGAEIRSAAALDKGTVVFASMNGKVYALNAADGEEKWVFNTDNPVEAPPVIADNTVYVGSADGTLFALDLENGKKIWSYSTEGRIAGSANVYLNGDASIVIVGSYDSRLHAIGVESGKPLWFVETGYFLNGTAAIEGSTAVFGGCDAFIHIVSLADGEKSGEVDTGAYIAGSPVFAGGFAYVCNYADTVLKIDVNEKRVVWKFTTGDAGNAFYASPALSGDYLIAGARDGGIYCLSEDTGELIWRFMTGGAVDSSPVIAEGKVVSASIDGFLYLIDLFSGELLQSLDLGSSISASPAVSGRRIFIGTEDGSFHAVGGRE